MNFKNHSNLGVWWITGSFVILALFFSYAYHKAFQSLHVEIVMHVDTASQVETVFWHRNPHVNSLSTTTDVNNDGSNDASLDTE